MRDWEKVVNVRFRYLSAQDSTCTETNTNVDFAIIPITGAGLQGCATNKKMWSGPTLGCPNTAGTKVDGGMLGMNYAALDPAHNAEYPARSTAHRRRGSDPSTRRANSLRAPALGAAETSRLEVLLN